MRSSQIDPLSFASLVSNDTADRRPANGSKCAAIRQDGTRDATEAGTGHGVLALSRHSATTTHADQDGEDHATAGQFFHRFHWKRSL